MQSASIETARYLVAINAVTRCSIECFDGRRWAIILRGREELIMRSARQDPKAYAKLQTVLTEVRALGLRYAEVELSKWQRGSRPLHRRHLDDFAGANPVGRTPVQIEQRHEAILYVSQRLSQPEWAREPAVWLTLRRKFTCLERNPEAAAHPL